MKKKAFLLTMLVILIISGCSRGINENQSYDAIIHENKITSSKDALAAQTSYRDAYSGASNISNLYDEQDQYYDDSSDSTIINEFERKLVKRANVRIRVDNLEAADLSIINLMKKYDGYIASTEIDENSHYYSLRIPSSRYDVFLSDVEGIGKLIRRSESTDDVTIRYYDLESQLESKKELLKTFQSYLEKAGNMEEILAVEYRIADLQREIEFTGTQLRNLTDRIDYATITLYLQGPVAITFRGETFGDRIGQLFGRFGGFLSTIAIILIGIVIYGIPILLLLILLAWLLFGRIGLMKKLWKLVMIKNPKSHE